MKERFKILAKDRIVKKSFQISLFLLVAAFIYTVFLYNSLPPLVPVFNQLPWGIERLGEKVMIFSPLIVGVIVLFFNMVFSQALYGKMPLVVRMLSITTLFISFIICIFMVRTTLLVV